VFALTLGLPAPPSLTIVRTRNQCVLSWPTAVASYILQATTNLSSGNWSSISNGIGTSSNNYIYSNAVAGGADFFRLRSQ
jgi:hypothetical protein